MLKKRCKFEKKLYRTSKKLYQTFFWIWIQLFFGKSEVKKWVFYHTQLQANCRHRKTLVKEYFENVRNSLFFQALPDLMLHKIDWKDELEDLHEEMKQNGALKLFFVEFESKKKQITITLKEIESFSKWIS